MGDTKCGCQNPPHGYEVAGPHWWAPRQPACRSLCRSSQAAPLEGAYTSKQQLFISYTLVSAWVPPEHTSQAHQNKFSSVYSISSHSWAWRPWPPSTPSELHQSTKQSLVANPFPVLFFRKVGKGHRGRDWDVETYSGQNWGKSRQVRGGGQLLIPTREAVERMTLLPWHPADKDFYWHMVSKAGSCCPSCTHEVPSVLAGWQLLLCFHVLGHPDRGSSHKPPKCPDHPAWWWRAWTCSGQYLSGRGNHSISSDIPCRSRGSMWLRRWQQVKNNSITQRWFNHTASRKHSLRC